MSPYGRLVSAPRRRHTVFSARKTMAATRYATHLKVLLRTRNNQRAAPSHRGFTGPKTLRNDTHRRTKPGVTRSIPRSSHPDHVLGHGRSSATSDATSRKRATLTAVTTTALRRAPEETHGLHQVPRIRARQSAHWAPSFTYSGERGSRNRPGGNLDRGQRGQRAWLNGPGQQKPAA